MTRTAAEAVRMLVRRRRLAAFDRSPPAPPAAPRPRCGGLSPGPPGWAGLTTPDVGRTVARAPTGRPPGGTGAPPMDARPLTRAEPVTPPTGAPPTEARPAALLMLADVLPTPRRYASGAGRPGGSTPTCSSSGAPP